MLLHSWRLENIVYWTQMCWLPKGTEVGHYRFQGVFGNHYARVSWVSR
jgi:hypothetical protein